MIPWQEAWQHALYGEAGFYRQPTGPAGHFTTSTHPPLGAVFAEAIVALADRERVCRVVDIGCGRGELLLALRALRPDLELTGVDVVTRPDTLPEDIAWWQSPGGAELPKQLQDLTNVLVIAHEWLDVIPCPILEFDEHRLWRRVLVDPRTGAESLDRGDSAVGRHNEWEVDLLWCARHWPLDTDQAEPGERREVGRPRDEAWADLCARVSDGLVVAIDYGHLRTRRPGEGTLTAYALGQPVPPIPDGSCDLTAHVAMDSLPGAQVRTQREWLRELGFRVEHPSHELASRDPAAYLAGLARMGVIGQLSNLNGLGAFLWAVRRCHGADSDG